MYHVSFTSFNKARQKIEPLLFSLCLREDDDVERLDVEEVKPDGGEA